MGADSAFSRRSNAKGSLGVSRCFGTGAANPGAIRNSFANHIEENWGDKKKKTNRTAGGRRIDEVRKIRFYKIVAARCQLNKCVGYEEWAEKNCRAACIAWRIKDLRWSKLLGNAKAGEHGHLDRGSAKTQHVGHIDQRIAHDKEAVASPAGRVEEGGLQDESSKRAGCEET